jgi:CRP-like cAMP-binding protein
MSLANVGANHVPPDFDAPVYLPLEGESASQARTILLRKGRLLNPALSMAEAKEMVRYMRLEHFLPGATISFHSQSAENGRLMLILAGEVSIRMRETSGNVRTKYSPLDQTYRWFTATEGATLGLVHAFSGLASRFVAQAVSDLFVASISREVLNTLKTSSPTLALRFLEMVAMELALVALDHERNLEAMNNVARSMQDHIDGESGETAPASL